jgi:high-affinity K+ transport system ATPase subunit B
MKPWMIEERLAEGSSGHIRYFTCNTLSKLVEDHGFNIKKITSDAVKLGRIVLVRLGNIIPNWGLHIIIRVEKTTN